VWYTDALEFYGAVREAAKKRIDPAEIIHRAPEPFFKKNRTPGEGGGAVQTEKKTKRDVNALPRGTRDGKIIIENIKPKLTGGVRKVTDERPDGGAFKETEDGEINDKRSLS
jgi:hypothetical protein